jgi:outer membrane protein assembly factor BamB
MKLVLSKLSLSLLLGAVAFSTPVLAADWPQWRGPQRDGISAETGLLPEWPADGPKLLWQIKTAGTGFSTPSVTNSSIFMLGNEGPDNEFVQALRVSDGTQIWVARLGNVGNPEQKPAYPGARSTPTYDGELLFALGSDGDLVCLESATGRLRWHKNLRKDFGGQPGIWAYAESPLVDGEAVVCTPGGADATIVSLNKHNGDLIWQSAIPGGEQAAYSSIVSIQIGGVKEYVQFLQKGVVGVEADSGRFLWRYDQTAKSSPANIPTPLASDGYIYSATGLGGGGLIHLVAGPDKVDVEQVYAEKKLPVSIGGTVLLGGFLYGTNSESLICLDFKSGEIKWQERSIGAASLLAADGRLYLHGENGQVALVEATSEGYHEKGRFNPPDQPDRGSAKAWAYPVVANGRLYVRDVNMLWCYDIAAAPKATTALASPAGAALAAASR